MNTVNTQCSLLGGLRLFAPTHVLYKCIKRIITIDAFSIVCIIFKLSHYIKPSKPLANL